MQLSEIIIQKIKKDGPVSFRDFMEMAMYYPSLGYYTSSANRIGPKGDYYTSPYLTSVFGELIGKQIEEMWHILNKGEFTIIEYGGGTGILCNDILNYIKRDRQFYNKVRYYIIEKNTGNKKDYVSSHQNVCWCNSLRDVISSGCILSNELIDNFPVHQVVMEDELMEVFVDYNNGFVEILRPAPPALRDYLEQLNIQLTAGYRTEINLQAVEWITEIAAKLQQGFVITIDYGFTSAELYDERRKSGTLLCYHKHRINDSPYIRIGEQDITAHVNFSALYHWGLKNGLDYCGFTDQAHFLRSLRLVEHVRMMEQNGTPASPKELFMIHTLLMGMGNKLKVLIQQKGLLLQQLSAFTFFPAFPAFSFQPENQPAAK
jgi:SAM-dependent MidA family methyltransferase